MEWTSVLGVIKGLLGLAGVLSIVIAYHWGYKKGRSKGFLDGYRTSEENWKKDKLRIYRDIQRKAIKIKTEKQNAEIVD